MWAVPLAERESHAELGIECRKLVQALELAIAARAGANIKRDAQLVMGRLLSSHEATTLLCLQNAQLAGAGAFLSYAYASLLLRCALSRRDGDVAMDRDKRF